MNKTRRAFWTASIAVAFVSLCILIYAGVDTTQVGNDISAKEVSIDIVLKFKEVGSRPLNGDIELKIKTLHVESYVLVETAETIDGPWYLFPENTPLRTDRDGVLVIKRPVKNFGTKFFRASIVPQVGKSNVTKIQSFKTTLSDVVVLLPNHIFSFALPVVDVESVYGFTADVILGSGVKFVSIKTGSFLSESGSVQTIEMFSTIPNGVLIGATRLGADSGVSGTGDLAVLTLELLPGVLDATIRFENTALATFNPIDRVVTRTPVRWMDVQVKLY